MGTVIMLDEESLLSAEIMGTVIPRDFRFNDMTGVQGLTLPQRCRAFPLTLEERARE